MALLRFLTLCVLRLAEELPPWGSQERQRQQMSVVNTGTTIVNTGTFRINTGSITVQKYGLIAS